MPCSMPTIPKYCVCMCVCVTGVEKEGGGGGEPCRALWYVHTYIYTYIYTHLYYIYTIICIVIIGSYTYIYTNIYRYNRVV